MGHLEELSGLVKPGRVLLIGEHHGSNEVPGAALLVARAAAAAGQQTWLGLEMELPAAEAEAPEQPVPVPVEQVTEPWAPVPPPLVTPELLESGLEEVPDATNQRFFIHSCADLRPCAAEPQ